MYQTMRNDLSNLSGNKVDSFEYFQKLIMITRKVIRLVADVCRSVSSKKNISVTPDFVFKQIRNVEKLLAIATR